jgi:hypothetical protein
MTATQENYKIISELSDSLVILSPVTPRRRQLPRREFYHGQISSFSGSRVFRKALIELQALKSIPDDDSYNYKPTPIAFGRTLNLIREAYAEMLDHFPAPDLSPDGEGGIVIEWQNQARLLRLVIQRDHARRSYIYHRDANGSDVDYTITRPSLTVWLEWLTQR